MEKQPDVKPVKSKTRLVSTVPIRVKRGTRQKLQSLVARINKKPLGRMVRTDEVIAAALEKICDEDIKQFQDNTLSGKDCFILRYREYIKANGNMSMNDYYSKIMSGEIDAKTGLKNSSVVGYEEAITD